MKTESIRIAVEALQDFCRSVFQACGLSEEDAAIAADVLVAADVRGIPSHGTARLARYVNGLETGIVRPDAAILHPGDSDHADDAGSGMDGQTWREFCRNDVSGAGQMFAQLSLKLACFLRRVDVDDAHAFNGTSP